MVGRYVDGQSRQRTKHTDQTDKWTNGPVFPSQACSSVVARDFLWFFLSHVHCGLGRLGADCGITVT
jgi:hypothetical protein